MAREGRTSEHSSSVFMFTAMPVPPNGECTTKGTCLGTTLYTPLNTVRETAASIETAMKSPWGQTSRIGQKRGGSRPQARKGEHG